MTDSNISKVAKSLVIYDEVLKDEDKLRFYYLFDPSAGLTYAVRQRVNGVVSEIRCNSVADAVAWTGFNPLSKKLMQAERFFSKFKPEVTVLINGLLNLLHINGEYYYVVNEGGVWSAYASITKNKFLESEEAQNSISTAMGREFIKHQEQHYQLQVSLNTNLSDTINQIKKLNTDIAEGKSSKESHHETMKVIDINDSISSVLH